MTALVWDEHSGRRYEVGVSHGVLYPIEGPPIPWNGLISVAEVAVGQEVLAFHQDGVKFLDQLGGRNFQAVVSAFSAPREFRECVGERTVYPGLRLTKQLKQRFNFSYQTHSSDGYLIHLLYNVLATPTVGSYTTEGVTPNPSVLSWIFDATPVDIPNFKSTAHLVIDTRKAIPTDVEWYEEHLYGSDETDPSWIPITDMIT